MANTLINPSIIAKEALFQLEYNTIMADKVYREYKKEFVKIGESVTIRKPVKFNVSNGADATSTGQDVTETSTSITVDYRKHVKWKFSSQDLTMKIEDYSERYIKPAMMALANQMDTDVATVGYQGINNAVGTPGSTPATFNALAAVSQRMDENGVPDDGNRCLVLDSAGRWGVASGLSGFFNQPMVNDAIRKGKLGEVANLNIYGTQNIQRHTVGTHVSGGLMNGATANAAAALVTDDWAFTTAILKKGDVITVAGVYDVGPIWPFQNLGRLKQFTVTADVTSDGAGNATIAISPALNDGSTAATSAYKNVSALPADGAAIAVYGTSATIYPQNLGFHKNCIALVTCPLELPDSAVFKARANWRGLSIRVIKWYDGNTDEEYIRLDIFYGIKVIYPDIGVRLYG